MATTHIKGRSTKQHLLQRIYDINQGKAGYTIRYVAAPDAGYVDYVSRNKSDMVALACTIGMLDDAREITVTEYPSNIHILVRN